MKFLVSIFLLITSLQLKAISPTEEGLFRNGINPDITAKLIEYRIHINSKRQVQLIPEPTEVPPALQTKTPTTEIPETTVTETSTQEMVVEQEPQFEVIEDNNFIRVLVFRANEENIQYLFLFYTSPDFSSLSLTKIHPVMQERYLVSSQLDETSNLLIGLLQMFTLNESKQIVTLLKTIEPNLKTNIEAMNQEKAKLYQSYYNYLKLIKNNPELREDETIENPRNPLDEEKKKEVAEIEKQPMYMPSSAISLKRVDKDFYWSLNHNNFQANFLHSTQFLSSMSINSMHHYTVNVDSFVLHTSKHLMPPVFIVDIENKEKITVSFKRFMTYPNSKHVITDSIEKYSKILLKNDKRKKEKKETQPVEAETQEKAFVNLLYRMK